MEYMIIDLINSIKEKLVSVCKTEHEAEQQAIWMLEEITKKSYAILLAESEETFNVKEMILTTEDDEKLNEWIRQRVEYKKPLQYIFGYVPFLNLKIKTRQPILIPRPETEEWVDWLIKKLDPIIQKKSEQKNFEQKNFEQKNFGIRILDIGTGSGCIALGLAKNIPNSFVVGIDINPEAIILAKENKKLNNVENIKFIVSDFYNNLDSKSILEKSKLSKSRFEKYKFDIIVSNPPYICNDEWKQLDDTVKNWEDKKALVAENKTCFDKTCFVDCLFAYRTIINGAKIMLRHNKELTKYNINEIFLEIGEGQGKEVSLLFENIKFKNIEFFVDLEKKQRVISASF